MQGDQIQLVFALGEVVDFPGKSARKTKRRRQCGMHCPYVADTALALQCAVALLDGQALCVWEDRLAWARRARSAAAI